MIYKRLKLPNHAAVEQHEIYCKNLYYTQSTLMLLVPPIALRMSKDSNLCNYDLGNVRQIGVGSAPIGEDVVRKLGQTLNVTRINQGRFLL